MDPWGKPMHECNCNWANSCAGMASGLRQAWCLELTCLYRGCKVQPAGCSALAADCLQPSLPLQHRHHGGSSCERSPGHHQVPSLASNPLPLGLHRHGPCREAPRVPQMAATAKPPLQLGCRMFVRSGHARKSGGGQVHAC